MEPMHFVAIREAVGVSIARVGAAWGLFEMGETIAIEIEGGVERILAVETGMLVLVDPSAA